MILLSFSSIIPFMKKKTKNAKHLNHKNWNTSSMNQTVQYHQKSQTNIIHKILSFYESSVEKGMGLCVGRQPSTLSTCFKIWISFCYNHTDGRHGVHRAVYTYKMAMSKNSIPSPFCDKDLFSTSSIAEAMLICDHLFLL